MKLWFVRIYYNCHLDFIAFYINFNVCIKKSGRYKFISCLIFKMNTVHVTHLIYKSKVFVKEVETINILSYVMQSSWCVFYRIISRQIVIKLILFFRMLKIFQLLTIPTKYTYLKNWWSLFRCTIFSSHRINQLPTEND